MHGNFHVKLHSRTKSQPHGLCWEPDTLGLHPWLYCGIAQCVIFTSELTQNKISFSK